MQAFTAEKTELLASSSACSKILFCDGCDSVDCYIKCRCRTIF